MCAGAIFDPRGKFGERRRSSVPSVAQDHGGIVATVTDSSSFGRMKSNICELYCLPPSEWIITVNVLFFSYLSWILPYYLWIDWQPSCRGFLSALGQGSFLQREAAKETKQSCVETDDGLHFNTPAALSLALCSSPILGLLGPEVTTFGWESGAGEIILIGSDWEPGDKSPIIKR